jgi:hypothetical protein
MPKQSLRKAKMSQKQRKMKRCSSPATKLNFKSQFKQMLNSPTAAQVTALLNLSPKTSK